MYQSDIKFLREPQMCALTGLSKSTRWRLEKLGKFPNRRQISMRAVGWLDSEIIKWIRDKTVVGIDGGNSQGNC